MRKHIYFSKVLNTKSITMIVLTKIVFIFCFTFSYCEDQITNPSAGLDTELCYQKLDDKSNWQVYTDNRSGTNSKNISNNSSNDAYSPLWSPDGKYIAFRYDRENTGGCDVYLYDIDSDNLISIGYNSIYKHKKRRKL